MAKQGSVWTQMRTFALALPEAHEEFPWGDRVAKVNKKIFAFLGPGDGPDAMLGLKLVASRLAALAVPDARPMGYGLGKAGWVVVPLHKSHPPAAVLRDWILESYCLVAPKKLAARAAAETA
jgi:predicted DNA-binding protein (MmcQ/YjbR family)